MSAGEGLGALRRLGWLARPFGGVDRPQLRQQIPPAETCRGIHEPIASVRIPLLQAQ